MTDTALDTRLYNHDLINAAMGVKRIGNEELARRTGLSPQTISAVRNGKASATLPTMKAIADALEIPWSTLFTLPGSDS